MVVESLLMPLKAEKSPWKLFFLGFLYATLAVVLSLWIFRDQASITFVFFVVMACIPLVYNTLKLEESKDLVMKSRRLIMHEHNKAISFLLYLFVGITIATVFWYVVLPGEAVDDLFRKQIDTINHINGQSVTGKATDVQLGALSKIFFNNVQVLGFAILFAFLFGAGAIFILTWNASVIGVAIGNFIRTNLDHYVSAGLIGANSYFHIVSLGLLKYALHGIPEIAAYFYGGLAGSILSVAIIRQHYHSVHFSRVMVDFSELVMIALGFLVVSAFLEVFVTPVLF